MGFAPQGLWVTGYRGLMGYGVQIPAHQLGGPKKAWDFRGYGLSEAWVMGVSTVTSFSQCSGCVCNILLEIRAHNLVIWRTLKRVFHIQKLHEKLYSICLFRLFPPLFKRRTV
jgi:hypothetical protein